LGKVAARLGVTELTKDKLLKYMKNNSLASALVLYEVYGASDEVLAYLRSNDPTVAQIFENMIVEVDDPEDVQATDLSRLKDDFGLIRRAAKAAGGLEGLIAIRQAMALPDSSFTTYLDVGTLAPLVQIR
jgi:hypothetical protein